MQKLPKPLMKPAYLLAKALCYVATSTAIVSLSASAQLDKVEPVVLEIGPHHRVMQTITEQVGDDGAVRWQTNRFTELANGIGFWDGRTWQPTVEKFEIVNGHALALQGPLQVILAANIAEAGAVDLLTSDGQRLTSNPRLLSLYDSATDNSVLVA